MKNYITSETRNHLSALWKTFGSILKKSRVWDEYNFQNGITDFSYKETYEYHYTKPRLWDREIGIESRQKWFFDGTGLYFLCNRSDACYTMGEKGKGYINFSSEVPFLSLYNTPIPIKQSQFDKIKSCIGGIIRSQELSGVSAFYVQTYFDKVEVFKIYMKDGRILMLRP